MSGHKPWSEFSAKLRADPKRRARIEERERAIKAELTINQPRKARNANQVNNAVPNPRWKTAPQEETQHE